MDGRRTRPAPDCLRGRALARIFVEATARALSGHDCRDLDNGPGRRQNAADGVDAVDAEAVAEWSVGQYEDSAYPAVVLGSPHGAAVHLAVAIGAPWLPTSFPVTLAGAHRMFVTADDAPLVASGSPPADSTRA